MVEQIWQDTRVPSEWAEQCALTSWLLKKYPTTIFYHVPNGGVKTNFSRFREHQIGLLSGVPDLVILTPPTVVHVEMKRTKGGKLSDKQKEVIGWMRSQGFQVLVCLGFDDARCQLEVLLGKPRQVLSGKGDEEAQPKPTVAGKTRAKRAKQGATVKGAK